MRLGSSTTTSAQTTDKLAEEQKKVLTDKNISFPQLSDKVADNEAQVKIITTEGATTLKLFPKYAPLAVENFFDSC